MGFCRLLSNMYSEISKLNSCTITRNVCTPDIAITLQKWIKRGLGAGAVRTDTEAER